MLMSATFELDPATLELIDKYVDGLCRKMNEPWDEIEDFREEMISNLTSSIRELMADGYSAHQAFKIAKERFGEPKDLEKELEELYRIKKIFARGLLISTTVIGALGALLILFSVVWHSWLVNGREIQV